MGWSSRDSNLRKNVPERSVAKPVESAPKSIPMVDEKQDLSVLDERSSKNVATLHSKVQQVFKNWIEEFKIMADAHGYDY